MTQRVPGLVGNWGCVRGQALVSKVRLEEEGVVQKKGSR